MHPAIAKLAQSLIALLYISMNYVLDKDYEKFSSNIS